MIEQTSFLGISLRTLAHRRGLVLGYYLVISVLLGLMLSTRDGKVMPGYLVVQTLTLGALFGGVKAGGPIKSYSDAPAPEDISVVTTLNLNGRMLFPPRYRLDERERAARDLAHYKAYRILLWSLAFSLLTVLLTLEWTLQYFERNAVTFLWALMIYALSLPQSVILWTEPEPMAEGGLRLVETER